MTAFTIRPARASDAEAVFRVTRASVEGLARSHYSPEQIAGWMDDRTPETYRAACAAGRIKVAEQAGHVVGYVDALPGELTRLFLLPEAAGQGLGKALLRVGLAQARQGHAGPLRIEATLNAAAFYARQGFRPVGQGEFGGRGDGFPPIAVVIMEEGA
jgi:predicted N-acetyltransferase YhbS